MRRKYKHRRQPRVRHNYAKLNESRLAVCTGSPVFPFALLRVSNSEAHAEHLSPHSSVVINFAFFWKIVG